MATRLGPTVTDDIDGFAKFQASVFNMFPLFYATKFDNLAKTSKGKPELLIKYAPPMNMAIRSEFTKLVARLRVGTFKDRDIATKQISTLIDKNGAGALVAFWREWKKQPLEIFEELNGRANFILDNDRIDRIYSKVGGEFQEKVAKSVAGELETQFKPYYSGGEWNDIVTTIGGGQVNGRFPPTVVKAFEYIKNKK